MLLLTLPNPERMKILNIWFNGYFTNPDDKLVNSALTTLDKIVNYIQSNFKVTL